MILVQRIYYWIDELSKIDIFLYSHHLSGSYRIDIRIHIVLRFFFLFLSFKNQESRNMIRCKNLLIHHPGRLLHPGIIQR